MLDALIAEGGGLAIVQADGGAVDRAALAAQMDDVQRRLHVLEGRRVGLLFPPTGAALAWLAALDLLRCDAVLLPAWARPDDLQTPWNVQAWLDPTAGTVDRLEAWQADPKPVPAGVTILTSGTTGTPKAIRHTWPSLLGPVRRRPDRRPGSPGGPRWLLAYQPHLYAGLQVIAQCLSDGGALVVVSSEMAPRAIADRLVEHQVAFASATPSFWRRLLLFGDSESLQRAALKQITVGGEAVDQLLLDQLRAAFPAARLTHIYATTELGRCFAVSDGRAGFPRKWLDEPPPDVALRVEEGQLLVQSRHASADASAQGSDPRRSDTWHATGDLVRIEGDRVHFVGRDADIINVGGQKVHPLEVEAVVRSVEGVADARVYSQGSSITGQLVACELVAAADYDADQVRRRVLETCRQRLHRLQVPRIVNLVEQIQVSRSGKRVRAE